MPFGSVCGATKVSDRVKSPTTIDRFDDVGCNAAKKALHIQSDSASEKCQNPRLVLSRIADLRPPTEFAGAANGSFDGLRRSISIEDWMSA
jgi:hypothetical protein